MSEAERRQVSVAVLREKGDAALEAMDPRATTVQFTYLRRHFWVSRDIGRGRKISACICAKCVALGPIA